MFDPNPQFDPRTLFEDGSVLTYLHRSASLRSVRDPDAREEAVAAATLKAWKALPRFRGSSPASFYAWLRRILHNVVVDSYRARKSFVSLDALGSSDTDTAPGLDARQVCAGAQAERDPAEVSALRDRIVRARGRLTNDEWELAVLLAWGWSQRDAAAKLGISHDAVRQRLARLRGRLNDTFDTAA